jgi:hypothetical protein
LVSDSFHVSPLEEVSQLILTMFVPYPILKDTVLLEEGVLSKLDDLRSARQNKHYVYQ